MFYGRKKKVQQKVKKANKDELVKVIAYKKREESRYQNISRFVVSRKMS